MRPFGLRPVQIEFDAVAVGIAQIKRFADTVVAGAIKLYLRIDQPLQGVGQCGAYRIDNREVVEAGGAWGRRRAIPALPGIETNVTVIAASCNEGGLIAIALLQREAEHTAVKCKRMAEVGHFEMHVSDPNIGADRTGNVAMSIGRDTFHRELIDLFGSTIRHSSSWIMRYSHFAPPDVLYTQNVPDDIVRLYNRECFSIDPFSNHWKTRGTPGVLTLSSLKAENVEFIIYSRIFGGAANISDEMAMFFTTVGHCCLALFLVRENGTFSPADKKRAELIFPALDGYHHAHLSWLFNGLRYTDSAEMEGFIKRPTLIQDRFQERVYANDSWTSAAAADPAIDEIVRASPTNNVAKKYDVNNFVLRSERWTDTSPWHQVGASLSWSRDL